MRNRNFYGTHFECSGFMRAVLFVLSTMLMGLFISTNNAYAATATWDGEGADNNFSTAANWSGDVVPSNGDSLVFPGTLEITTLNNDIGLSVTNIDLGDKDAANQNSVAQISIDGALDLQGVVNVGIDRHLRFENLTLTGDTTFNLEYGFDSATNTVLGVGDVSISSLGSLDLGSYSLTVSELGYTDLVADNLPLSYNIYNPEFSVSSVPVSHSAGASININATTFVFGSGSSNPSLNIPINVNDGLLTLQTADAIGSSAPLSFNQGQLDISNTSLPSGSLLTFPQPMVFNGNLYGALNDNSFTIGQSAIATVGTFDLGLSGAVTVNDDIVVDMTNVDHPGSIEFSGELYGAGVISMSDSGATMTISATTNQTIMNNGTYESVSLDTIEDDDASTNLIIVSVGFAEVNGTRGDIIVTTGGTLRGTGTVGNVLVQPQGSVEPGTSPGCISTGNLAFSSGAIYDVEIEGLVPCSQYDQTQVTGSVTLGDADLNLEINGFTPSNGQEFTIIDNDGADSVVGTFNGLAEGAQVLSGATTFTISYAGGDGNDVVLTVGDGEPNVDLSCTISGDVHYQAFNMGATTFNVELRYNTAPSAATLSDWSVIGTNLSGDGTLDPDYPNEAIVLSFRAVSADGATEFGYGSCNLTAIEGGSEDGTPGLPDTSGEGTSLILPAILAIVSFAVLIGVNNKEKIVAIVKNN